VRPMTGKSVVKAIGIGVIALGVVILILAALMWMNPPGGLMPVS
jgi:hypothetical protein